MSRTPTVTVEILDKPYQVACPPDQEQELVAAATHLDRQMRDIRATGKVIGSRTDCLAHTPGCGRSISDCDQLISSCLSW